MVDMHVPNVRSYDVRPHTHDIEEKLHWVHDEVGQHGPASRHKRKNL